MEINSLKNGRCVHLREYKELKALGSSMQRSLWTLFSQMAEWLLNLEGIVTAVVRRGIVFIQQTRGLTTKDASPEPLPATEQQQQGHLPAASVDAEACAASAADLQHRLRGVQGGGGGRLCSREAGKQVFDVVVQSLSLVPLFVTPWTAARQASPSSTTSQSLLKLMSIELVMPPNHLILCHPLLLLSSIFPSIRVFSNELALPIRWPKYWSFSFNISPSSEYSG